MQQKEDGEELPASSSASESAADSTDADLEAGVAEWRQRGLPPAQSKAQRWGAPYHLQFAILFTRYLPTYPAIAYWFVSAHIGSPCGQLGGSASK